MDSKSPRQVDSNRVTDKTDAELLAALVEGGGGSHPAWSALVARYAHRLYAVARSFGLDQATAEDLVQIAWLRLLEHPSRVREPAAVGPWLCTVVRNEALRRLSRRREIPVVLGLDARPDDGEAPDARLVRQERISALRLAFAHLGGECQQLLRLMVAEPPLSYDEIAAALGRPRGSLGPSRRRCLDQLRARLPSGFEP